MTTTANLGFPRIGEQRELKKALESYWKGSLSSETLLDTAAALRRKHWQCQKKHGITHIPSNDFSLYDQVLDTAAMVGAIPERYGYTGGKISLDTYFAMARGKQGVTAMEMTKWFDTNYHYLVPELSAETRFCLATDKAVDEFKEAKALGIHTRPVLLGPVSFLLLSKLRDGSNRWRLLPELLITYTEVLLELVKAGADWVQIDEPCLVLELDSAAQNAYRQAYAVLTAAQAKLMLTTYFGALGENLGLATGLPISGLHIDLARAPEQLESVCDALPQDKWLSLGLVDGRNIWKTDLQNAESRLRKTAAIRGEERLIIAPSCSLLHVPVDLSNETALDGEIKDWLAFAVQKVEEISALGKAMTAERDEAYFSANARAVSSRSVSARIHNAQVQARLAAVTPDMARRNQPFAKRIAKQQKALNLPLLPTTTIGSFPQTSDVREARAKFKKGELSTQQYEAFLEAKTVEAMQWQDTIGLDVPVHGEFERNDMVEYFGEQLEGFTFTKNGWVQSYGSRCVKPPVIYGDVNRPKPMTVRWSAFAQQHTDKPVKGMLTGPVTILQWSFVRDDQPRSTTCRQIALAIRDEVQDLEAAGIRIIQIDEPAIREGLPLRKAEWKAYLDWAVEAFRLSACGVEDETQIHTHMCYSEFNDIIESIAAMDADVISIETSRSQMELLDAFVDFKYPNDIGPGVYDIHSPRVPDQQEMEALLRKALAVLEPQQLWVNPDCGLKTRGWEEVKSALEKMVAAAAAVRGSLEVPKARAHC